MKFKTLEEVKLYLSGAKVECLECGKKLRALGAHLLRAHSIGVNDYREKYGIPWTWGLVGSETSAKQAESAAKNAHLAGYKYKKGTPRADARPNCEAKRAFDRSQVKVAALASQNEKSIRKMSETRRQKISSGEIKVLGHSKNLGRERTDEFKAKQSARSASRPRIGGRFIKENA